MLTRRAVLAPAPALLLVKSKPKMPNIIWYMPDQWRGQALGSMGDVNAMTPNLDRMAADGLQFRNTFANSPVCCAARATLLTGLYAHKHGITANDLRLHENIPTMAKILAKSGYRTAFIGKWHLDGGPRVPGFVPPGPRRQGFEYWAANECSHDHFNSHYFRDDPTPRPFNKYEAEGWTDLAIEFLESHKSDQRPFFLMVAPGPPHDPYGAPQAYLDRYDPEKIRLRGNYNETPNGPTRKDVAAYYAACAAVDDQVGRLDRSLSKLNLREDTAMFFLSDHGDMLGSHGLRLKRKPHEESIRIPGIIRYPRGIKRGRATDDLFTQVDLPATTLGLCGIEPPPAFQGANLVKALNGKGKGPTSRPDAFFQIFGPYAGDGTAAGWRGVRTDRYTYARYIDRSWVLFDNEKDPFQRHNLIGDDSVKAVILPDLEARLAKHMTRTGDSWSFNWSAPVEDGGRLYKDRTYYSVAEYLAARP